MMQGMRMPPFADPNGAFSPQMNGPLQHFSQPQQQQPENQAEKLKKVFVYKSLKLN